MDTLLATLPYLADWSLIVAAVIGTAWGILGGALPGISPSITMALLLPFTYVMDPASAIVMLASTYVGAEYGGSVPAILINTPGTNSAAATVVDEALALSARRWAGHDAVRFVSDTTVVRRWSEAK